MSETLEISRHKTTKWLKAANRHVTEAIHLVFIIKSIDYFSKTNQFAVHDVLIFLWGKNAFSLSRIPNYWSFHMIWVSAEGPPGLINTPLNYTRFNQSHECRRDVEIFIHRRVAQMNLRVNRSVWRTQLLIITDFTSLTLIYFFFFIINLQMSLLIVVTTIMRIWSKDESKQINKNNNWQTCLSIIQN